MYFWGNDFEELCEKNCRQYRVYADIYPKDKNGGYSQAPAVTYTAERGSENAGAVSFETAAIVSVKIVKGMTSGSFSYGGAFGGQLTLVTTADTNIPADDTKIVISVSFVSDTGAESGKAVLGTFFTESAAASLFTKTIKAADGISKLTKYYVPDPAEFPMTAKKLLEKAAAAAGANGTLYESDLKFNNPNITEAPLKKKGVAPGEEDPNQTVYIAAGGTGEKYHSNPDCSGMDGNVIEMTRSQAEAEGYTKCTKKACMGEEGSEDEYYTYREIAGMIASINAGNAFVNALNYIDISTPDTGLKREIPIKSVISYTDSGVVNRFSTTFWAQTYEGEGTPPEIDPLSKEYDPSIMIVDFPLKTDSDHSQMQQNIDGQIGGISYNGIVIKKQGTGRQEIGDLLAFSDTYRNKAFDNVLVMGIVYDISAQNGFTETLYSLSQSEAKQQAKGTSVSNRIDKIERSAASGGGSHGYGGSGVGEFTNEAKNSEIFNSYKDTKNDSGAVIANKNYINPKTNFAHVGGYSNSIDEGDITTLYSIGSAILGGSKNNMLQATVSAICGGAQNKMQESSFSFIGAGFENSLSGSQSCIAAGRRNNVTAVGAGIVAGESNTVSANYSVILAGSNNAVSNEYSAILAGISNSVEGFRCVVLCGFQNRNLGSDSAIINGTLNSIDANSIGCAINGCSNRIERSLRSYVTGFNNILQNGESDFIAGYGNYAKASSGCKGRFICGQGGILKDNIVFAVGNSTGSNQGASEELRRNIFYIDDQGNAYAKSFNIIGESSVSEAAAFSAKSADNPDLAGLTEKINQMQSDIEALRTENAALKAEIEILKEAI